jgi:hypothetical protein
MTVLDYTTSLVAGEPENVNDVVTMFNEVRAAVNNIDETNLSPSARLPYERLDLAGRVRDSDVKSDAAIALSKLQGAAWGQLPLGNGSNLQLRNIYGSASLDGNGLLALGNGAVANSHLANSAVTTAKIANSQVTSDKVALHGVVGNGSQQIGAGSWVTVLNRTLTPGWWLVIAEMHQHFWGVSNANLNIVSYARTLLNGAVQRQRTTFVGTQGDWSATFPQIMWSGGNWPLQLQAFRAPTGGDWIVDSEVAAVRIG